MNARQILSRMSLPTFAVLLLCLSLADVANAQSGDTQKPKIKNFGQMDVRFYRGAQPEESDYKDLAAIGIKIIFDLRDDPENYARRAAEAVGMRYVNIPLSDTDRPSDESVEEFLKIVANPFAGKFYVHCKGGRHRTGAMTAIYRLTHDEWTADRAWAEMKEFDFEYGFGHDALKNYVFRYYTQMGNKSVVVNTGTPRLIQFSLRWAF